nr:reverse transcriptase domain-containing protein [Tanacetum cinerariifolium]
MSTRSSVRNLFLPLDYPELTIRRRSRADPTLLNDFDMAAEGNGDPPVSDLRTIEELCQPSLNGRGGPIALISIHETNFGLKNDMIQQVQNCFQFHGLPDDDANKHLDKLLCVTQSIKVNGVTDDAFRLYLFPQSLTHHTTAWFDRLPRNSINTFEQMAKMFLGKYFPPSMVTKLRNEITNFRASHGQNPPPAYQAPAYQALGYQALVHQPLISQPQVVTTNEFTNYIKANDHILKNMQTNMTSLINSNLELKNMFGQFMKMNTASSSGSGSLLGNTITNPKEDLKGITTRSRNAYQGPTIPTTYSSLPQVVERETKVTKDMVHPTNNGSTKDLQPSVVHVETPIQNSEPVVTPIIEPIVSPVSALKPNQKPSIPYPSRLLDQKLRDKANDQKEKFFQIFQDLNFNISFVDALILMPKFSPTIKTLLTNKDKLSKNFAKCALLDEVLGFFDVIASGIPTPYYDPIVSTSSLTPFGDSDFLLEEVDAFLALEDDPTSPEVDSDFLLEEVDAFLALEDDPTSPEVDRSYVDTEGDILLLESFFNDDPLLPPPNQGNYFPQVQKELKICEAKTDKSSIDEPPEVELKDLPPHLEYEFLEGDDKFPVIIAKDLSDEEKIDLIKILMEEDFKPMVQHQRRVNPKIHDVIKKEVEKLLDAGLIYPISDSPWVIPVHCVPNKGGFTVVENEENELILDWLRVGAYALTTGS